MTDVQGRSCPLHYRYNPRDLCRSPEPAEGQIVYVVGGLYGNPYALNTIEAMAAAEQRQGNRVQLVFNGDFNWFNAEDALFREINLRVLEHTVSLGNVEYELANPSDGAGCGCAYPGFVEQAVVDRSNRIMARLQSVAAGHPDLCARLGELPRYRCLMFGGLKVLVLHGDPESLAGWGLSHEQFADGPSSRVENWFRQTGADVIVCTHTCLPVLWSGVVEGRRRLLANNGAAGMGNLRGDLRGLVTRLAFSPSGPGSVARLEQEGLQLDLVAVDFDQQAWLGEFDRLWSPDSPAVLSYRRRILDGTSLTGEQLVFGSET